MTGHTQQVPPGKPIDWPLVVLTCTRLAGVLLMLFLTWQMKCHADIAPDAFSLLPSAGQYATGLFFFWLLLTTPQHRQAFNALYLFGLVGVALVF